MAKTNNNIPKWKASVDMVWPCSI